jgi:WD40 repeat protein
VIRLRTALLATLGALLLAATPAQAAFPGANGMLVLQPTRGSGLLLADIHGRHVQSICIDPALCGRPRAPRFSPDGRDIVFADSRTGRPVIVAADGTCMWCLLGPGLTKLTGAGAAFTGPGLAVSVAGRNGLWQVPLTSSKARVVRAGRIADAVWSARGELVFASGGSIWFVPGGRSAARWLAHGGQPSFSPDGRHVAFVRRGWIWTVSTKGGRAARLVRGSSPAFSPDGHQLAFIGSAGAVYLSGSRGRHARRIPGLRARALDWQPLPRSSARCAVPAGQQILAQTPEAVLSTNSSSWWGCLLATGRRWSLAAPTTSTTQTTVGPVGLAGRFAAIVVSQSATTGACSISVSRIDLATGTASTLYTLGCTGPGRHGVDSLALNSSGFTAWHAFEQVAVPQALLGLSCPTSSYCAAVDGHGNAATTSAPPGGWSLAKVAPALMGPISCATAGSCVAAESGAIVSSSGGSWSAPVTIDGNPITSIACPSSTLCVAVDNAGNVLTSNGGTSAWTAAAVAPGQALTGVSCPTTTLCVAVGAGGIVLTSTNPGGGAGAWSATSAEPGVGLGGVSCPSRHLCVATDSAGNVLTDDPAGTGTWTINPLPVNPGSSAIAPACASSTLCLISYGAGVLSSTDPRTPSTWTATALVSVPDALTALTCAPGLCLAADQTGNVFSSANGSAWTSTPVDTPPCGACIAEQVFAADDRGRQALDTVQPGAGNVLAGLSMTANVLSWTRSGQPESAQLH